MPTEPFEVQKSGNRPEAGTLKNRTIKDSVLCSYGISNVIYMVSASVRTCIVFVRNKKHNAKIRGSKYASANGDKQGTRSKRTVACLQDI